LRFALSGAAGEAFRSQVEDVRTRTWIAVPGITDIWGLPLVSPDRRV